jgi:hypothetical protein
VLLVGIMELYDGGHVWLSDMLASGEVLVGIMELYDGACVWLSDMLASDNMSKWAEYWTV